MHWSVYLQTICQYFYITYGIDVFIVDDGRCRGGVRLLFEDNLDSLISNYMMGHEDVRYTVNQEKFRAERRCSELIEI